MVKKIKKATKKSFQSLQNYQIKCYKKLYDESFFDIYKINEKKSEKILMN